MKLGLLKLATLIVLGSAGMTVIAAQPIVGGIQISPKADGLAEVQCDLYNCREVSRAVLLNNSAPAPTATINPTVIAPPAAHRFMWKPSGSCVPFPFTLPGVSTIPFVYLETSDTPVPLGSTHATVTAMMRGYLGGSGVNGVGSIFGRLKMRRAASGVDPPGSWVNIDTGFVYTRSGTNLPSSRYGPANFQALVDLATFDGGTSVPSLINIEVEVFSIASGGFVNAAGSPAMCNGTLLVSF